MADSIRGGVTNKQRSQVRGRGRDGIPRGGLRNGVPEQCPTLAQGNLLFPLPPHPDSIHLFGRALRSQGHLSHGRT